MKYKTVYPRYSLEENKAKKYDEETLKKINSLQQEGLSYWKIAKELNLPKSSIRYICMTQEQKDAFNKMKYDTRTKKNEYKKDYNLDRRIRKGEKILTYMKEQKKEYIAIPENKEKKKEYMKKYRLCRSS